MARWAAKPFKRLKEELLQGLPFLLLTDILAPFGEIAQRSAFSLF